MSTSHPVIVIDRVTPAGDPKSWTDQAISYLAPHMNAPLLGPLYRYTSPTTVEIVLLWQLPSTDTYWANRNNTRLASWWRTQDAGPVLTRQREILTPLTSGNCP